MVELKKGSLQYAEFLPSLIYESASSVLDYIFQGESNAFNFLNKTSSEPEGQFSVFRHHLACIDEVPVGCVSLWHTELPAAFHKATFASLEKYLSPELLNHVIQINPLLVSTFAPPRDYQLCFGHLAVKEENRGQNVGSKLLAFVVRRANMLNKRELALDVEATNEEALQVYERWGFMVQSTHNFKPLNTEFYRMTREI